MKFLLTAWEHDDLLAFFSQYNYHWNSNEEQTLFVRLAEDGTGICGVQITHPASTSPYRMYGVSGMSMALSSEETSEYLREIIVGWTSYGQRARMAVLVKEELKTSDEIANLMGIALSKITQSDEPIPDDPQYQPSFFERQRALITALPSTSKIFYIATGGYVKLELRGGLMAATISVPGNTGGYTHPLRGFVRHPYYNAAEAALDTFGWTEKIQLHKEAYDSNPEHPSGEATDGSLGFGLSDSSRTPGAGDGGPSEPEADLPDESKPPATVHGLSETVLLEVCGELGGEETGPPNGVR